MTQAEESEMVLRWFAPFTSVNAAVTDIFKQIKKKKKFLSEEWYPNLADGSFLCTSIRALRMMGVMFLSSSALGVCLFFSATQKAGNTKDYNEVLENSSEKHIQLSCFHLTFASTSIILMGATEAAKPA